MFTKLVRLGRDAELRSTPQGDSVINLAVAYNIGRKDNQRTQWMDVSLWGNRAEALAPYLLKGKALVISVDDLEVEVFTRGDNTPGAKLKGRVVNIEFAGGGDGGTQNQGGQQQQQRQPQQATSGQRQQQQNRPTGQQQQLNNQQQQQQQQQQQAAPAGFDDFDDDIPF